MYRRDIEGWLKHIDFIVLDMICLQLAYVLAYAISGYGWNLYSILLYRNMAIYLELADLVVIFAYGTMRDVMRRGHYRNFMVRMYHAIILTALSVGYLFLIQRGQLFSRKTLILMLPIYVVLTYIVGEVWRYHLRKQMKTGSERALLIITTDDIAARVVNNMRESNYARYTLVGVAVIDADRTGDSIEGLPVVADKATAPMYVCQKWVDEVLVVVSDQVPYPNELMDSLMETGVTVHLNLAKITNIPGKKQFVEKVGDYTVLTTSINYATAKQLLVKRAMDIAAGIAGCILTGIIFIFVAPAIYISSPGPIFFAQERVGKNGKTFKMYKFRSMYMDAEERKAELMKQNKVSDARMFKMDFDPRVIGNKILPDGTKKTGIGDFIRRTSLDEFPQFYNVLKGDMSIVGTRPPLLSETALYDLHHRSRLAIKPGITGLWQVSGRSDITDFEEVVKLDREYITNWNIGMDIKILLKTVLVVLKKDGSM